MKDTKFLDKHQDYYIGCTENKDGTWYWQILYFIQTRFATIIVPHLFLDSIIWVGLFPSQQLSIWRFQVIRELCLFKFWKLHLYFDKEILNILLLYSHFFPVSYYSESAELMSKHRKDFKKLWFEMITRAQVVNTKIVTEHKKFSVLPLNSSFLTKNTCRCSEKMDGGQYWIFTLARYQLPPERCNTCFLKE